MNYQTEKLLKSTVLTTNTTALFNPDLIIYIELGFQGDEGENMLFKSRWPEEQTADLNEWICINCPVEITLHDIAKLNPIQDLTKVAMAIDYD